MVVEPESGRRALAGAGALREPAPDAAVDALALTSWPRWYKPYIALVSVAILTLAVIAIIDSHGRASPLTESLGFLALPVLTTAAVAMSVWWRRPWAMLAAALLFDAEGLVSAASFVIGMAYAILLPIVGLVLVLGVTRGRVLTIALASAATSGSAGVAIAMLVGPPSALSGVNSTWIPITVVVVLGAYTVIHLKLISDRSVDAMRRAETELASRRAAEAELERTSSLLTAIMASTPVPTEARLADGRVLLWNPAAERTFGWTAAELLDRPMPDDFASPAERERPEGLRPLLAGDQIRGEWGSRRTKDGHEVPVEVWATSLPGPDGEPMGVARQLVDMTDRLAIEGQLRQASKIEAIGRLSGSVAHDFNNLLTAIRGYIDLARGGLDGDAAAVRADLDEALRSADRASELTRQLLAFSHPASAEPREIDPSGVVTRVAPMLHRLLGEHVTLRLDLDPAADSRVRIDPSQLEQVLIGLVVNAQDAMPHGGTLIIEAREVEVGDAWADGHAGALAGLFVRLAVTDSGVGMDRETLARAVVPFLTGAEGDVSTGMGLATVLGIVTAAGGFVNVESAAGEGTRFEVYLPLLEAHPDPDEAAVVAGGPGGGETVLLLEDDAAVRAVAERTLAGLGYRVLVACDGAEAIDIVERRDHEIDLVVSDIVLPGMQGPDVVRRLLEMRPDLRVVFCSGFPGNAPVHGDHLAGFPFLAKPYTPASLAAAVRAALDAAA